jgi:hypothetical protein
MCITNRFEPFESPRSARIALGKKSAKYAKHGLLFVICGIFFAIGMPHPKATAQTGAGIGIYPTGTETGIGYRSAKETRWAADVRFSRANLFTNPEKGSWVNEASAICRVIKLEKVRFHIGLGARADWSNDPTQNHRFGAVMPIGVEAYPFPFQNAGLFFEAAPFLTTTIEAISLNFGLRTVAGFVFYIPKKVKDEKP